MDQAPRGGPSSSPRREGAAPPSTLGGGGVSSLWQQKKWEQPDWAGGWAPHRGARVGVQAGGVRGLGVGCWELLGEGGQQQAL